MSLRFANYRRLTAEDDLDDGTLRAQLEALAGYTNSPEWRYEIVDAVSVETGDLVHRVAFFPIGEIVVFRGDRPEMVATASQHLIRECVDREQFDLWTAVEGAYRSADPAIQEVIEFRQAIPEVHHPRLGILRFQDPVWSGDVDGVQVGVDGLHEPDAGALARIAAVLDDAGLAARLRTQFGDNARLASVWFEEGEEKLAYRTGPGAVEWCGLDEV